MNETNADIIKSLDWSEEPYGDALDRVNDCSLYANKHLVEKYSSAHDNTYLSEAATKKKHDTKSNEQVVLAFKQRFYDSMEKIPELEPKFGVVGDGDLFDLSAAYPIHYGMYYYTMQLGHARFRVKLFDDAKATEVYMHFCLRAGNIGNEIIYPDFMVLNDVTEKMIPSGLISLIANETEVGLHRPYSHALKVSVDYGSWASKDFSLPSVIIKPEDSEQTMIEKVTSVFKTLRKLFNDYSEEAYI